MLVPLWKLKLYWIIWDDMALRNGVPNGSRTRVLSVKGICPRPLDDRDEAKKCKKLVIRLGLEPRTLSLKGRCSTD
jgi:hypothetical protein